MVRRILSETKIFMKLITKEFDEDDKEGFCYFIGNSDDDIDINLKNTRIRFLPPTDEESNDAEISIMSGKYSNKEFEKFMFDDDGDQTCYFYGECNMDIGIKDTVFKFFPAQTKGEWQRNDMLIINQTQRKGNNKDFITNPVEVRIFMHKVNATSMQDAA